MRGNEDLIPIRFTLMASGSLDMERVEDDPVWSHLLAKVISDSRLPFATTHRDALVAYMTYHLAAERLLSEHPAANGPASLISVSVEILERGTTNPLQPIVVTLPEGSDLQTLRVVNPYPHIPVEFHVSKKEG